ncbi:MAG: ion transporter [Alkalibacterium sp.]|nr:ion transporter [Alkalibacterium sp.]TVP90697.1 MAG: ion transporter [Alkalibacterium sp.]
MTALKKYYDPIIIILATFSVSLVILDSLALIDLTLSPVREIDILILLLFTTDYIYRLFQSDQKGHFFKNNIMDLIAIIPFHSVFAVFRMARLFRIARLTRLSRTMRMFRLTRVVGLIGKATKHIRKFFNTNGFAYMVYASGTVLLLGATVYSIAENVNFIDSLWWAFVTSTTVGYGDISPVSAVGRITAMVLMLTGIGMFGALTSTITSFFIISEDENEDTQHAEIKELNQKIGQLLVKIENLEAKSK